MDVVSRLEKRFGSVAEFLDAWEELKMAHQGSSSAANWEARVRRIFAMRGMLELAMEPFMVTVYRQCLRRELRQLLVTDDFPTPSSIAEAASKKERMLRKDKWQPSQDWRRTARAAVMQ